MSEKKNPPGSFPMADQGKDREQGLAENFQDLTLEEIAPGIIEHGPDYGKSILEETADAVKELVTENAPKLSLKTSQIVIEKGLQPEILSINDEEAYDISNIKTDADLEIQKDLCATSVANADTGEIEPPLQVEKNMDEAALLFARWKMTQKICELILSDKPYDVLVESILQAIITGFEAEAGSILELDSVKKDFYFRASIGGGDSEQLKAFRVPYSSGLVGHVAESLQPIVLQDLQSDERALRSISLGTGFQTTTFLAAPILIANNLYGVIELFNKRNNQRFTENDSHVLVETLKVAAKALEVRFLLSALAKRKAG